jgi:voltage-gated potassium channel Kch
MRSKEQRELAYSLAFVLGFAVAIILGYWGWSRVHENFKDAALTPHVLGRLYLTLQLFVLHPQDLPNSVPWQLQAARFLAPAVLALATVLLLTTSFRRRLLHAWFRRSSGHEVVCGAGVHGTRLAANLVEAGKRVVLVDIDERAPGMQGARRRREYRLIADTVRADTLLSAGVRRAERLIAVAGDDVVNAQIASSVRSLAGRQKWKRGPRVLVQAEDAPLARFLEDWASGGERDGGADAEPAASPSDSSPAVVFPRIEIFGANAIAAAALFGTGATAADARERGGNGVLADLEAAGAGHLLLAGDHPLLEAIVVAALRRGRARRLRAQSAQPAAALRITIVGVAAERQLAAIEKRWHPEPAIVGLAATNIDLRDEPSLLKSRWLPEWRRAAHALVACEDELDSIALAVALSRALGRHVRLTRIRTQPSNELDEQLRLHTLASADLAVISVYSIADLAWGGGIARLDDIAAPNRLAAALRAEGVEPTGAGKAAEHLLTQHWLGVHSDPAPRVTPASASLIGGLLRAAREGGGKSVSVSALVDAGLDLDLESRSNIGRAAEQLTAESDEDAFNAWCEYARRTHGDEGPGAELLARAQVAAEWGTPLRLKAQVLEVAGALEGLDVDHAVLAYLREHAPPRIAIFAGGAASMSGEAERAAAELLERALYRYDGMILTGGNDVGLCGAARTAAEANGVPVLGYAPIGQGFAGTWLRSTPEGDFSNTEPVAMWTDLLAAERVAADVRVVAFPGGRITTAEIILARALGAVVAWLDPCEEGVDAFEYELPFGTEGLLQLPSDAMTLRAFLMWPNESLDGTRREVAARALHTQYRQEHRKHKEADDPALAPWEQLLPTFRYSNLAAVDDIPNKLHIVGKRLCVGAERLELDAAQVELLAEIEHGRFNYERLSTGWQLGGARLVSRRTSPHLTPWTDLDEKVKKWDRDAVLAIDGALREAGWGVTAD